MSAHPPHGQEDENIADLTDSPGRRLRVARQTRGLDLDRIAAELHLSPKMIELLEQDDYDALPGEVFIVGYIRKYARVVALDPEPLLNAYRHSAPKPARAWLRPRTTPRSKPQVGSGHLVVRLASFGVPILLVALAFVWWQSQGSGETVDAGSMGTRQESVGAEMPDADADADAVQRAGTDPRGTVASSPPNIEAARTPAQEPAYPASPPQPVSSDRQPATSGTVEGVPTPEPTASGPPAPAAGTAESTLDATPAGDVEADAQAGRILLTFDGPCWVDVRDSERKYKLFGEMKKGDRHVLDGTPPYSVILGNAAAVTITVDGAAFDLSAIAQGNVARFTLDPSKSP